jgi:hypothetical protein
MGSSAFDGVRGLVDAINVDQEYHDYAAGLTVKRQLMFGAAKPLRLPLV